MHCPVCDDPAARDITRSDFEPNGRSVRCTNCGDYDIAASYEVQLMALDLEARKKILQKAKRFAGPGERPCINSMCF